MFGEQQRFMLLLIAPAALLLLLFQVVPIAIGANASFPLALYNPKKTWVGLDHYYAVITDPAFLYVVLPNTFVFMILSVAGARLSGWRWRSAQSSVPWGKSCRRCCWCR